MMICDNIYADDGSWRERAPGNYVVNLTLSLLKVWFGFKYFVKRASDSLNCIEKKIVLSPSQAFLSLLNRRGRLFYCIKEIS